MVSARGIRRNEEAEQGVHPPEWILNQVYTEPGATGYGRERVRFRWVLRRDRVQAKAIAGPFFNSRAEQSYHAEFQNGAKGVRRVRKQRATSGGILLVALGAALWGTDAIFRRGLALELPATTLVFLEHVVLATLTFPVLWMARDQLKKLNRVDWTAALIIGGGSSALATVLFTAAFQYGDPTTPLLLQKVQPLVAVGFAGVVLGERVLPRYAWFLVSGITGAYLVAFANPTDVSVSALQPALLALGAAVFWGLGTVLGRLLTAKMTTAPLTALRFLLALPVLAVLILFRSSDEMFPALSGSDMIGVVLLALVPGLLALMLYYNGLQSTPAPAATLAELAFPVSAVVLNYFVFDTVLSATQWIGVVLLAATIVGMSWLTFRAKEQSAVLGIRELGVAAEVD